jgi:alpha-ketoglutarate-dependent taurine dioxygenase
MLVSAESSNKIFNTTSAFQRFRSSHRGSNRLVANCWPDDLLRRKNDWTVDLAVTHPRLLVQVALFIESGSHWTEYLRLAQMVNLETLRTRLTKMLFDEFGVAVLRIPYQFSDDTLRLLVLLVGQALGANVSPSVGSESRPLFAVTATDDPTIGGRYGGNGRNSKLLALHTDGSGIHRHHVDVLGMLCLQAAQEGGASRIADARRAWLLLSRQTRDLLRMRLPRTDPYAPGLPIGGLITRPIFEQGTSRNRNTLSFSYHPSRIREGSGLLYFGPIERHLENALCQLDDALERSSVEVLLNRGEILILNNSLIAHGRTAFKDDPTRPRLLERLWVEV